MIRKKLFITLALGMTLAFAGCSSTSSTSNDTTASSAAEETEEGTEADDSTESEDSESASEATTEAIDFTEQYDYSDYIKLGTYKGIEYEAQDTTVTDEEVEENIQSTLDAAAEVKEDKSKTEVEDGDIVNIDYTGKMDGEEFDGGSAEGVDLEIGSGTFIDDFEDQLIGMKVGDEKTIKVTFPDDYSSEDLAGKEAEFDVKINYIGKEETPELTDEYVKENLEADSVADYKKQVREELEESAKETAEQNIQSEVWSQVIDNAEVTKDLPDDMVEYYKDMIESQYSSYAEAYGMEIDEFIEQISGGMTLEECAEDSVKREMVAKLLIAQEKIEVSDSEYQEELETLASDYGYDSAEAFEEANGKDAIEEYVLNQKLLEYLVSVAKEVKATTAASTEATTTAAKEETTTEAASTEEATTAATTTEAKETTTTAEATATTAK